MKYFNFCGLLRPGLLSSNFFWWNIFAWDKKVRDNLSRKPLKHITRHFDKSVLFWTLRAFKSFFFKE